MRIVAVGPLWRGSNAGGLFRAMSRKGILMDIVDEFYHISLQTKTVKLKVLERLLWPWQIEEYNKAIVHKIDLFTPEILFVYKGAFVKPETLLYARSKNCKLVQFFPDVSIKAHRGFITKAISLYDLVFTTKTFGIKDMKDAYGVTNSFFIPHGLDPEIHRPLPISEKDRKLYGCDVSFIGTWSPKKEEWLNKLKTEIPNLDLKIFGSQWEKANAPHIRAAIQGTEVLGDLYAVVIQCSKINLGILSEQRVGSSSGDLITSRTFHIPGASGLMLHERNEESLACYEEDKECSFFDGPDEMVAKVRELLADDDKRERIRWAGHKRAMADHSLDTRAATVIDYMERLLQNKV